MIKQIIADLHTHTDVSAHAYSSVYENIIWAKRAGLAAVAITNHGPASEDGAPTGHFRNLRVIPRYVDGILVLRGAECNIMRDGSIDLDEDTLKNRLDMCVASIHDGICHGMTQEQVTAAYLKIAENPLVSIIGHCGTAAYPFDRERVIKAWKEYGKTVEVNEGTFLVRKKSIQNCAEILRLCKKYEVPVCADSDAHFCSRVGNLTHSIELLNSLDFPDHLVVNAREEQLYRWMEERGISRDALL